MVVLKLTAKCGHYVEVELKEGVTEEQALADPMAQAVVRWHEQRCDALLRNDGPERNGDA